MTDSPGKEDGSGALAAYAPTPAPHVQAMWPWASHLVALGLSFFIYKMETIICIFLGVNPGIEPKPPELQADSLPSEPPGKPILGVIMRIKFS